MTTRTTQSQVITRFAPSPTGYLHKGHAYSARQAYDFAEAHGGRFLLRIEDIDTVRCKPGYTDAIYDDLAWLGIRWEHPVRRQSEHFSDYQSALQRLMEKDLVYPCFCTRKQILAANVEAGLNPISGPDGPLYPGTCRLIAPKDAAACIAAGVAHAWRLNTARAVQSLSAPLRAWHDERHGPQRADSEKFGDIILARKDTPTSYHLSVVVDDALQGITHIVRGMDLFEATHIHVLLQQLLGLPTPVYLHHRLVLEESGEKFSKSNQSVTLRSLREAGYRPADLTV